LKNHLFNQIFKLFGVKLQKKKNYQIKVFHTIVYYIFCLCGLQRNEAEDRQNQNHKKKIVRQPSTTSSKDEMTLINFSFYYLYDFYKLVCRWFTGLLYMFCLSLMNQLFVS
jgi:hypothetical protein